MNKIETVCIIASDNQYTFEKEINNAVHRMQNIHLEVEIQYNSMTYRTEFIEYSAMVIGRTTKEDNK